MTEALSVAIGESILATAYGLARRHRLEAGGVIYCWNCNQNPALIPSLHCAVCLTDSWRRNHVTRPQSVNREQNAADVAAVNQGRPAPVARARAPRIPAPVASTFAAHAHPEDPAEGWERE